MCTASPRKNLLLTAPPEATLLWLVSLRGKRVQRRALNGVFTSWRGMKGGSGRGVLVFRRPLNPAQTQPGQRLADDGVLTFRTVCGTVSSHGTEPCGPRHAVMDFLPCNCALLPASCPAR